MNILFTDCFQRKLTPMSLVKHSLKKQPSWVHCLPAPRRANCCIFRCDFPLSSVLSTQGPPLMPAVVPMADLDMVFDFRHKGHVTVTEPVWLSFPFYVLGQNWKWLFAMDMIPRCSGRRSPSRLAERKPGEQSEVWTPVPPSPRPRVPCAKKSRPHTSLPLV